MRQKIFGEKLDMCEIETNRQCLTPDLLGVPWQERSQKLSICSLFTKNRKIPKIDFFHPADRRLNCAPSIGAPLNDLTGKIWAQDDERQLSYGGWTGAPQDS